MQVCTISSCSEGITSRGSKPNHSLPHWNHGAGIMVSNSTHFDYIGYSNVDFASDKNNQKTLVEHAKSWGIL